MGIDYGKLKEILERKANKAIGYLDELKCFVPEFREVLDSVLYISETLKDLTFLDIECPNCKSKKGDEGDMNPLEGPKAILDTKYKHGERVPEKLVMFYSDSCGPCQALKPAVEKLVSDRELPIEWVNVDTKEGRQLIMEVKIQGWPFVLRVLDGMVVAIKFGANPEEPFEKHYHDLISELGFELGEQE